MKNDLPKFWYNINGDSPVPPTPVLHPGTKEPVTPDFLSVLFPMELILQEISTERYIEIPEEVREIYKLYRPTPLIRARRLEKALGTPAHIYYKYEGVSPSGSHKPNTAIAQAFYNKAAGTKALTTETGAGQWGTALAMACNFFDIDLEVYMVKVSYNQKPYRRIFMETYGAQVFASPTDRTEYGRAVLAKDPENNGSLGIAISEAVEVAATSGGKKKYSLGSVLNHVLLHQTVIGEEALKQMDMAGEYPDVVIGCVGGGSNFAGIAFPFLRENLKNGQRTRLVAVEPTATPSLTKGVYAFDYGDTAQMAPIVKMYTLGHTFMPPGIHAGGLRYHGMAPTPVGVVRRRLYRSGGRAPDGHLRSRRAVCPGRRHHPGARVGACHPRGHRRGAGCQGQRREARDPVQPVRPWALRHDGLPGLSERRTGRLRISGRGSSGSHAAPAAG